MNADPEAQRRLLDLQAIDTALAQLAHKRRNLPEHAELDRLARTLSTMEDERVRAQVAVDDLDRDIARLEKDVDQVRARAAKDQSRLDVGTGPARELEALQHELATLARRQNELEDAELELMEQREEAAGVLAQVEQRLAAVREQRAEVERRRDEALAAIAKDEELRVSARKRLRAGRCEGCRLELSGSEWARVRNAPADEVVRCDECRRILVRTAESGL